MFRLTWTLAGLSLLSTPLLAQTGNPVASPAPTQHRATLDLTASNNGYSSPYQRGRSVSLRGSWALGRDTVLNADLLRESKFSDQGGVAAVGVTQNLNENWYVNAGLSRGWGGANWIRNRVDAGVSRKWGEQRQIVTTLAGYRAISDGSTAEQGLRIAFNYYLNGFAVFEFGETASRTNKSNAYTFLPYFAVTLGTEGNQYWVLRYGASVQSNLGASNGSGSSAAPLVDLRSRTWGVDWRYWMNPDWGVLVRAERELNTGYSRTSIGGGMFLQM